MSLETRGRRLPSEGVDPQLRLVEFLREQAQARGDLSRSQAVVIQALEANLKDADSILQAQALTIAEQQGYIDFMSSEVSRVQELLLEIHSSSRWRIWNFFERIIHPLRSHKALQFARSLESQQSAHQEPAATVVASTDQSPASSEIDLRTPDEVSSGFAREENMDRLAIILKEFTQEIEHDAQLRLDGSGDLLGKSFQELVLIDSNRAI